jgi:hypothetical protein
MFPSNSFRDGEFGSPLSQPSFNRECVMQQTTESRRAASSRREPAAAIPKFRELRLSAVVAACAWQRRPLAQRRDAPERRPTKRTEKD